MKFHEGGLSYETLLTRMEGATLVITLNRPEVRNAINWVMERELFAALEAAEQSDEVRAVVLTGAGKMFSAGHDLKQVAAEAAAGAPSLADGEPWHRKTTMLPSWRFKKPFIIAAHGFVGPFANGIVLTADFAIAAHGTRFSFEMGRVGLGPPYGVNTLFFLFFPPRVASKMWAMGGWMDAEEAHRLHYVQRVVDESEVVEVALEWAAQASLIDPDAYAATKLGMRDMYDAMGLQEMLAVRAKKPFVRSPANETKNAEFFASVNGEDMQGALNQRDAGIDPDFTRI